MNVAQGSQLSSSLPSCTPVSELRYDLSCELYRMATFSALPAGVPVSERSLARAGFYYTGVKDKVRCFCCGLMLDNWKPGDRPADKHRTLYPSCAFVRNLSSASVSGPSSPPPPPSGANSTHPLPPSLQNAGYFSGSYSSFPSYPGNCRANQELAPWRPSACAGAVRTVEDRLLTFRTWPLTSPRAPELARAGFYYVGHSDDVKCFCCDGGLRCWESGDDPWVEHAKWFPRCEYLIRIKGQEFIRQIQASYPHLLEQLLSTSDNTEDENSESPIVHFGPGESSSEDAVMMNTPVVTAALEMGFSRSLVRQTVQSKILTTGENYRTVNEIVSDLLHAEDELREEEKERAAENRASDDVSLIRKNRMVLFRHLTDVAPILDRLLAARVIDEQEHRALQQKTHACPHARELIDTVLAKGGLAVAVFKSSLQETDPVLYKRFFEQQDRKYLPPESASDLSLEEQLRRLQEERTCKVCMDREVSIVFIPCGHLVVCRDCAPSLRRCPICRAAVKGIVRTFLS
uniref:Baculoviral IAP repeat-containing protein 3-like n=1 Tax=Ursus maritimus TaxID=29073 RepID=A0A452TW67_URSMA